ncbi:NAD(P)/FAD-dependent oxidoreductase [Aestuariivirga sp.]|uniref:NAD(P)/FAD-dependent oxidoreductase n=1 Tax=Aestuariivirga sp. TaxID=2650926 RepID=UPI0039E701E6
MTDSIETLVIGAGAVGLAIARELASHGQEVLVAERNHAIGLETSARNSEVIHAGLYYPPGSLKAELCVKGRQMLYAFCRAAWVEARAIGKLVVAVTPDEIPKLHAIRDTARANGVTDLELLSASEAMALEPALSCVAALLSPSTGIVDSSAYMLALQGMIEAQGGAVVLHTSFVGAEAEEEGFRAVLRDAEGGETELLCRRLINAAGHGAHQAALSVKGYDTKFLPPRFLARGNYCSVSGASPFTRLIYPVPVPGGLGIHLTLDLGGAARLGPDVEWVETLDYTVSPDIAPRFKAACASYWPGIATRELSPSSCGIRPKVHGPDRASADFIIQGPDTHGLPGLVNLFGIELPGLTSSLALAERVAELAA